MTRGFVCHVIRASYPFPNLEGSPMQNDDDDDVHHLLKRE